MDRPVDIKVFEVRAAQWADEFMSKLAPQTGVLVRKIALDLLAAGWMAGYAAAVTDLHTIHVTDKCEIKH